VSFKISSRLGIAAPQASASHAGAAAFTRGGNAVDAALAAAVSLAVTYPNNCALGGDLIALVRRADGQTRVVNASGPAPAAIDADALRSRFEAMPIYGPLPVTVPGLVAGLHALWSFAGTLPWEAAFDAAIEQAEDGEPVAPTLAAAIATDAELLWADAGAREVFFDGGAPLTAGATLRQPALAATLRSIQSEGPNAFYSGENARSIVATLRGLGSPIAPEDLAHFVPELARPLEVDVGEQTIATAMPNSQGFLLPLILRAVALGGGLADPLGAGAGELARVFQLAMQDRDAHLADPARHEVPLEQLLDPERLRRALGDAVAPRSPSVPGSGDTVAVVAADDAGNSVSLIQSVFHAFGSGILDAQTGVVLHNRGAFFSLDPASPNVVAGGKRPAHTLMPCVVLEHGAPVVVAGTMGGSAQPQILAQVLLRLAAGEDAETAVSAPRWVVGGLEAGSSRDQLLIEPGVPERAKRALAATGLPKVALRERDENVGHAQLVTLGADASLAAASDPRSEGAGLVVARGRRLRSL
jgi:oxamate amidohydrolase